MQVIQTKMTNREVATLCETLYLSAQKSDDGVANVGFKYDKEIPFIYQFRGIKKIPVDQVDYDKIPWLYEFTT